MMNGRQILVVDDEPMVRAVLESLLRAGGYAVELADSAQAALVRLATGSFDLILTDHIMPQMTGVELASVVKTRWPSLPVVLFTGFAPEEPCADLDLVLNKPSDFCNLLPSIQALLNRPPGSPPCQDRTSAPTRRDISPTCQCGSPQDQDAALTHRDRIPARWDGVPTCGGGADRDTRVGQPRFSVRQKILIREPSLKRPPVGTALCNP